MKPPMKTVRYMSFWFQAATPSGVHCETFVVDQEGGDSVVWEAFLNGVRGTRLWLTSKNASVFVPADKYLWVEDVERDVPIPLGKGAS